MVGSGPPRSVFRPDPGHPGRPLLPEREANGPLNLCHELTADMSSLPSRSPWPLRLSPFAALTALALVCFARLVAEPGALIVDGDRPSRDDLKPAADRSVGNDLTRLF